MREEAFVVLKITWDDPDHYATLFEWTEPVCVFDSKEDAENAMRTLAELEYPGMAFQLLGCQYISMGDGDPFSSGIRYAIRHLPRMSYSEFEQSMKLLATMEMNPEV